MSDITTATFTSTDTRTPVRSNLMALHIVTNHSRARGVARAVLNVIAYHVGPGGAWPSMQTLATESGFSLRAVRAAIHALVGLGEIVVLPRAGSPAMSPRQRSHLYQLALRCPDGCCGTTERPARGAPHDRQEVPVTPTRDRQETPPRPAGGAGHDRQEVPSNSPLEQSLEQRKSSSVPSRSEVTSARAREGRVISLRPAQQTNPATTAAPSHDRARAILLAWWQGLTPELRPSGTICQELLTQATRLLDDGVAPESVAAGVAEWATDSEYRHPSALPLAVSRVQRKRRIGAVSRRQQETDDWYQRALAAAQARDALRAQGAKA